MFIQNKGNVTMTVELLDTEEAQADDPLDVQVTTHLEKHFMSLFSHGNLGINNQMQVNNSLNL